jgi:hypothetical protein
MPRGNLEAIAPRALVLASARKLLDRRLYGATMELLRKHRVDLNILWDHDPNALNAYMETAVQQVRKDRNSCFIFQMQCVFVTMERTGASHYGDSVSIK